MPRLIAKFVIAGIAWVFLLSIPVGQGKIAFDLAHFFLVDSTPVHWVSSQFSKTVAKTEEATQSARDSTEGYLKEGRERLAGY